jgi:hypothetical protein
MACLQTIANLNQASSLARNILGVDMSQSG